MIDTLANELMTFFHGVDLAWLRVPSQGVLVSTLAALLVTTGMWRQRSNLGRFSNPLRAGFRFHRNRYRWSTDIPAGVFRFVFGFTGKHQLALLALSVMAMPILYATLELPKTIINGAINSGHFPKLLAGVGVSQLQYLFLLCGLYLVVVALSGFLKYSINVYKGRVGEGLLRRLRLSVYRKWRSGGAPANSELIPVIIQEVEPVGGFASDSFVLPAFQGGTFLTILTFMLVQDLTLGIAAIALLPVKIVLIPRLQRRVNTLARHRVKEIRTLGGLIGESPTQNVDGVLSASSIARSIRRIQAIRFEVFRRKFFMKALSNFISHMTPFFFYSIGGYLVINGELSFGALVAVLAAYKDFSAPLRELFKYYQTMEDVRVRYEEIRRFLGMGVHSVTVEVPGRTVASSQRSGFEPVTTAASAELRTVPVGFRT